MDARRMQLLATVVEHGSFTRAAAALALTQPSLSRQIAALEQEAGARLLHRVPSGVRATEAGLMVARRGQVIEAQVTAAQHEIARLRGLRMGRLRLSAFPSAAATLALDVLVALREAHPDILVTVQEDGRDRALHALRTGAVDLAITFAQAQEPTNNLLDTTLLFEEPLLLALPVGDPRGESARCSLSEFSADPWIVGTGAEPGLIARACLSAGFTPRIAARLDNQPAIQSAVAAGVGITLVPALAAGELRRGLATVELAPPVPFRMVHAHRLAGPADHALLAGLQALAGAAAARGFSTDPLTATRSLGGPSPR